MTNKEKQKPVLIFKNQFPYKAVESVPDGWGFDYLFDNRN